MRDGKFNLVRMRTYAFGCFFKIKNTAMCGALNYNISGGDGGS